MIFFSACPSHVSLDISNESQVLVPVCEPVLTTGITIIKLKLQQPQVAQVGYLGTFRLEEVAEVLKNPQTEANTELVSGVTVSCFMLGFLALIR